MTTPSAGTILYSAAAVCGVAAAWIEAGLTAALIWATIFLLLGALITAVKSGSW